MSESLAAEIHAFLQESDVQDALRRVKEEMG